MTVFVKAPARVTLYLDIIGKDPQEGHHLVSNVNALAPALFDEITIEPLDGYFHIVMEIDPDSKYSSPAGEDNACFKAASLLRKAALESSVQSNTGSDLEKKIVPIKITLKKNIPNKSGLAGGSSDAAAAIKALNKLWGLNFPNKKLKEIASQISMDSAFFVEGCDYAYCTHFGEMIEPIESDINLNIEIVEAGIEIDPEYAYARIDLEKCRQNKDKARVIIEALLDDDKETVLTHLHNDFEYLIQDEYPDLMELINQKCSEGFHTLLTGSGGCYFTVS